MNSQPLTTATLGGARAPKPNGRSRSRLAVLRRPAQTHTRRTTLRAEWRIFWAVSLPARRRRTRHFRPELFTNSPQRDSSQPLFFSRGNFYVADVDAHLAGSLGQALGQSFIERSWITRGEGRTYTLTPTGRDALADSLALRL